MAEFGQPVRQVKTFTAAFDGECETCVREMFSGDEIGYLPGYSRPSCSDCVDEYNED